LRTFVNFDSNSSGEEITGPSVCEPCSWCYNNNFCYFYLNSKELKGSSPECVKSLKGKLDFFKDYRKIKNARERKQKRNSSEMR
jgi:hypothetical protein